MSKQSTKKATASKQEAKGKGNQTATQKKTRGGKTTGAQPAAGTQTPDATVELLIDAKGIHSLTGRAKGTKVTPTAPAQPEVAQQPDDAGELVVFAFRLTRAERDVIHEAAGSAKASRFVRTLAVAAAKGDAPTVMGILDTISAKQ